VTPRQKRILLVSLAVLLALFTAGWRGCRCYLPSGASPLPWTLGRVDGPTLTSPDGAIRINIYFNDAGAAHSGNHWTWLVTDSLLIGRRVVAEGYTTSDVAVKGAPLPHQWVDARTLKVSFVAGRRGERPAPVVVRW
jgi:hypothetical protein